METIIVGVLAFAAGVVVTWEGYAEVAVCWVETKIATVKAKFK